MTDSKAVLSQNLPDWIQELLMPNNNWERPTFALNRPTAVNQHDVIVIGAGIGGLMAGALLACRGLKVAVFEQHSLPGGYCTSWKRHIKHGDQDYCYIFDSGPVDISGLGAYLGSIRKLLNQLGCGNRLAWHRVKHEYIFDWGRLKVPLNIQDFFVELCDLFPLEKDNLTSFLEEVEVILQEINSMKISESYDIGLLLPPSNFGELIYSSVNCPHVIRWANMSCVRMLDAYFSDARLKEILSVITCYVSEDVNLVPAIYLAILFSYYFDGGFYPAAGSQSFPNLLADVIKEHGGQVFLNAEVFRIQVDQGKATGIELKDGSHHYSEVTISNADIKHTFLDLISEGDLPSRYIDKVKKLRPASSAFHVFLGVDFIPEISEITFFRSRNIGIINIGIMMTSKIEPLLAPPGHSTIILMTSIPPSEAANWNRESIDYVEKKSKYGDELISMAEQIIPNLRSHIVYREESTPATLARYTRNTSGTILGWQGFNRLPMQTPIKHLYLVGSGTFPGHGVEGVAMSGMLAANAIYPESARVRESAMQS